MAGWREFSSALEGGGQEKETSRPKRDNGEWSRGESRDVCGLESKSRYSTSVTYNRWAIRAAPEGCVYPHCTLVPSPRLLVLSNEGPEAPEARWRAEL